MESKKANQRAIDSRVNSVRLGKRVDLRDTDPWTDGLEFIRISSEFEFYISQNYLKRCFKSCTIRFKSED
uniref:DUF3553 domain-containing protein n=1 Tax=Caenorhabditis tropicalis TaxID=1561998 RepID=A0A1I7U1N7_9PELO